MAVLSARQMFPNLESDRMTISKQGQVAIIKNGCIELYGRDVTCGIPWVSRKISAGLSRPYDLCFAPNDALVVSDVGDNTIKIFDLTRNLPPVNQIIIGHDFFGRFIVLDRSNVPHVNMRALTTFRIPQNVAISPGPLSQLFVSSSTDIILMNMDWSKLSLVSYLLICSPLDWRLLQFNKRLVCDNVSSVQDHKNSHKVGGFNPMAITEAQFCGMFYHVTETDRTGFSCLEQSKCNVGIRGDRRKFSETVVIYVRITEKNGRLLFQARYGNCYEGVYESTTHAEYFMLVDDDFRQAVNMLQDQNGGDINLFMNKQPCCRSTGHGKKTDLKVKDCAQDLIKFYKVYCLPHGIKLVINLCQLYKIGMSHSPGERSLAADIENARLGVKMMLFYGIELMAMRKDTWKLLAEAAKVNLPAYQDSDRQKLDQYINLVLSEINRAPIQFYY
ncbi:uncharacterized protein LOC111324110 [Stylophora pistillata]|nr:uncharacterized protein LOC111324110 [Stylophora pistillata]